MRLVVLVLSALVLSVIATTMLAVSVPVIIAVWIALTWTAGAVVPTSRREVSFAPTPLRWHAASMSDRHG